MVEKQPHGSSWLFRWWRAWYGGPLFLTLAFGIASFHFISHTGYTKTEKKMMAMVSHYIHQENHDSKNVVYIDVSFDKMLVPRRDVYGDTIGEVAITDRRKLLLLLQQLSKDTNYLGVILDVSLNASTPTEVDRALADSLLHLPRTVISCATEGGLIDSRLKNIAGQTAYPVNAKEAGFVKYPLMNDGEKSMPLLLYEMTTGRKIKHLFGGLYWDGRSLSTENLFPTLDGRVGTFDTLYLGRDIIKGSFLEDSGYLGGKYVIVGALSEGDVHNSYSGFISGPEINTNTYFAMLDGKHRIGIFSILLILGFYYLLFFSIVRSKWKVTDRMQQSQWWLVRAAGLILSGLIYTILLNVPFLLNYLLFGQILSFTSVAFGFLAVNKIVQTNKAIKR